MDTDQITKKPEHDELYTEKRSGTDRRKRKDRRDLIRFETCRRKNHGRRKEDKDPWKDALELD